MEKYYEANWKKLLSKITIAVVQPTLVDLDQFNPNCYVLHDYINPKYCNIELF